MGINNQDNFNFDFTTMEKGNIYSFWSKHITCTPSQTQSSFYFDPFQDQIKKLFLPWTIFYQVYEFIWSSEIDKVKRQQVTQNYLKGRIKMLDINNFLVSLKCSWIKKWTKDNKPLIDFF